MPDPAIERRRERIVLAGDLPTPANPPSGCRFRTRCQKLLTLSEPEKQLCIDVDPALREMGGDQRSTCHYAEAVEVFQLEGRRRTPQAVPQDRRAGHAYRSRWSRSASSISIMVDAGS